MTDTSFTSRVATLDDLDLIKAVMDNAIKQLQADFLSPEQVEASAELMGLDTQLIEDGTYFLILAENGDLAGCGGWSRRATLYGGNHTKGRDARLLNPETDPARVRAMYTNPAYTRRGVGRKIMDLCEGAAASEGFQSYELMATLAGVPLYRVCGYAPVEEVAVETSNGVKVPLVRMQKHKAP
ncbi:GNAT family N-acetyltransferase [Kordiimonas marina]|uniref:GNAT family N-acetyltransferase n=1 Tax=Kordiimonas marina TaxID=2872312 RepID=UPI001FF15A09|nr:GNAT family N-acetyltransferase [Kordiimonas marina]